jgi:hypothetical protein
MSLPSLVPAPMSKTGCVRRLSPHELAFGFRGTFAAFFVKSQIPIFSRTLLKRNNIKNIRVLVVNYLGWRIMVVEQWLDNLDAIRSRAQEP